MKTFTAWAISTGEGGFIGRYWRFWNSTHEIPAHMEGCRIAMFKTRKLAREGLKSVNIGFPKAKVVKVTVSVDF